MRVNLKHCFNSVSMSEILLTEMWEWRSGGTGDVTFERPPRSRTSGDEPIGVRPGELPASLRKSRVSKRRTSGGMELDVDRASHCQETSPTGRPASARGGGRRKRSPRDDGADSGCGDGSRGHLPTAWGRTRGPAPKPRSGASREPARTLSRHRIKSCANPRPGPGRRRARRRPGSPDRSCGRAA